MSNTQLSAIEAANLANAVYGLRVNNPAMTDQQQINSVLSKGDGVNLMNTIDAGSSSRLTGTSGAIIRERSGFAMVGPRKGREGEWILTIRGTQTGNDWLSNLNVGLEGGPGGLPVHAGFHRVYKSLRNQVYAALPDRVSRIHVVGHSLGGAIASLFAADFASSGGVRPATLYTFGQPRVVPATHAPAMERLIGRGNTRRCLAIHDPVPMIPFFPYGHYADGAHRFNSGLGKVTLDNHDMKKSYIANCRGGWPVMPPQPARSVGYWLEQAALNPGGFMASAKMWALEKALMMLLQAVGITLTTVATVSFTLIDHLAKALMAGARMIAAAEEQLRSWITSAAQFLGIKLVQGASITMSVLSYILKAFGQALLSIARRAVDALF